MNATETAAATLPLASCVLQLAAGDEVGVATRDLPAGTTLLASAGPNGAGQALTVSANVPRGHKIALKPVSAGAPVHKYGQSIGRALTGIRLGDHVHTHNLGMDEVKQDYEFGTARVTPPVPSGPRPTFQGYRRANGKAGTRNYVGILTSVNCSASTARMIADQFRGSALDAFPNVDGVFALTHGSGCGMVMGSAGAEVLVRTLGGYAAHPNFAGLLVLGLGCEMLQTERFIDPETASALIERLTIQDSGGNPGHGQGGVALIEGMLPAINELQREPVDVSELVLGLNCGGSDGYSGITANPALGVALDLLVAYGGTSALAETPEVFGAEHLLTRRAVAPEVGQRLLGQLAWWQDYASSGGGSLDNNPSPGNKAGGLTTILEKSLGAVAKAGQAELSAVYAYAEPMTSPGLVFMDTPGYDPVSVTGLVAGAPTWCASPPGGDRCSAASPCPASNWALTPSFTTECPRTWT